MKRFLIVLSLIVLRLGAAYGEGEPAYKEIKADKIRYNVKSGSVASFGKTEVIDKDGRKMTLLDAHLSGSEAYVGNMTVEWSENVLLTARHLEHDGDITRGDGVSYTTCNNCDEGINAWTMHASRMVHDKEEKEMYFYNAWLDMYGVPVFYFPFISQPDPTVKRRSGFLLPEFRSTSEFGIQVNAPLYIVFDDYHDMTLTTAIMASDNPLFMGEHRLRQDHAAFDTTGSYTYTRAEVNRWHIFNKESIELGENMRLGASINRTSDKTYLQQHEFYGDQPFLESNARLEMFGSRGYAVVETNIFQELRQTTDTDVRTMPGGDILPRVHGSWQTALSDDIYGRFTTDLLRIADSGKGSSINRAIGDARLIAPLRLGWQKITLSGNVRNDYYQYNNIEDARGTSRILASGYADWEMPFAKTDGDSTQIIKPKVRLTVMNKSPEADFKNMDSVGAMLSDVSLFSNNRYSGYDLWVSGAYADYGVFWIGHNDAGQSAEAFIGQTYDINTDNEPDVNSGYHNGASDVVGRVGFSPGGWLKIMNRFRLARGGFDLRHLETTLQVGDRNNVWFGYIWAEQLRESSGAYIAGEVASEGVVGGVVYLTDRLVLRANGVYNFTYDRWQRYSAGLYYEHPCWTVGAAYYVDNAVKYTGGGEMDFTGAKSWKFNYKIKLGK